MYRDRTCHIDPERDYLREQIRKLVQLVAALMGRAFETPHSAEARDELAAGARRLFGHDYEVLGRLTPHSAALLLGQDVDRITAYAEIVAVEGRLCGQAGDEIGARRLALRAATLTELAFAAGHCDPVDADDSD